MCVSLLVFIHPPFNTHTPQHQVQMRDLPGFAESRRQIVVQKPGVRVHWIGYAVAAHLAGQHELAVKVGFGGFVT